jgi:hypothetical protein
LFLQKAARLVFDFFIAFLALELAPNYLKARLRRAQCYEKVEKQEEALEGINCLDYKVSVNLKCQSC